MIVTDVNIIRIDAKGRKEQRHGGCRRTVSVWCLSALLEHAAKMVFTFRCLWLWLQLSCIAIALCNSCRLGSMKY